MSFKFASQNNSCHYKTAYAAADAHCLTVLFDRCYNANEDAITAALADPSRPLAAPPPPPSSPRRKSRGGGGGRGGGGRLNAAARAAAAEARWATGGRVALSPPLNGGDVLGIVGSVFDDGRKGVVDVLTGGHDDGRGGGGRGGVEECGNFYVIYVNVGKSTNRKYRNEFWVDKNLGNGNGDASNGIAVLMSWFSGTGAQGGVKSVAGLLAAATPGSPDDEVTETADATDDATTTTTTTTATKATTEETTTDSDDSHATKAASKSNTKKTAILFLRTYCGPYVCCGRLRAAATKMDRQTGLRVDFQLTDVDALVASGYFDELIGEYLNDPEDRELFCAPPRLL